MSKSETLRNAKKAQNDEFYTLYEDIEKELNAYLDYNKDVFRGKTILCPCDDPEWSNFSKYFAQNFEKLGLKKLICTSYANDSKLFKTPIQLSFLEINDKKFNPKKTNCCGKIFTLTHDLDNSGRIDINDLEWEYLEGDGDFRSDEIKKLRDEADFVITNPPFSLFREFLPWILDAKKQFIILGSQNALTYKDIFPLIQNNVIWLGCRFNERINGKNLTYKVPDFYELNASELFVSPSGEKYITVPGTGWFTNIDHGKRHQPLALMSMNDNLRFSKHKELKIVGYKKYDNFDAIDVPFVDSIPSDYDGCMGVPITFLGKYCPEQFEIIRFRKGNDDKDLSINGVCPYFRVIIRRKK